MTFNPVDLIQKKRDGKNLTSEELHFFIQGIIHNEIPDYQAAAFLMAVYFQGMDHKETATFSKEMTNSGEAYDLSSIPGPKVDKHSTGGVGDKVSLILAPLAAACGLTVPMMAGRGLGHSGGTVDKLEAIPGYQSTLDTERFQNILKTIGCSIIAQSENIAPADKKLYALRDVTATVSCIPLIVGSILSKKKAEGTETLILDVKFGSGAFMKHKKEAKELAVSLVQVAKELKMNCRAILSDMNQPLGYAVGNSLEVIECLEILQGKQLLMQDKAPSNDLIELTLQLCAHMLQASRKVQHLRRAYDLAKKKLEDGSAWEKFKQMVLAHGADLDSFESSFPLSKNIIVWKSPKNGYLSSIDTEMVGKLSIELGAGRKVITSKIDHSVGFVFHKKLGSKLKKNDPIVTVYAPQNLDLSELEKTFHESIQISQKRKTPPKLILDPPIK